MADKQQQQQLVSFDVDVVQIPFALGKRVTYKVRIKSLVATTAVAYKVQTTSPKKFGVKPHTGILKPLATTTFVIILQPQHAVPEDFRISRDKFLVTTMLIPEEQSPPPSLPTLGRSFSTKRYKGRRGSEDTGSVHRRRDSASLSSKGLHPRRAIAGHKRECEGRARADSAQHCSVARRSAHRAGASRSRRGRGRAWRREADALARSSIRRACNNRDAAVASQS